MSNATINTPRAEWFQDEQQRSLPRLLALEGFEGLKGRFGRPYFDTFAHLRDPSQEHTEYIWPNPGEHRKIESGGRRSFTRFEDRVRRAAEPDVWGSSVETTAGLPFVNQVVVSGESALYRQRKSIIDGVGSLHAFLTQRHYWKLVEGISFGIADMPSREAIERGAERIPYLSYFSPTEMIDWRFSTNNGDIRLEECRLRRNSVIAPIVDPKSQDPNNRMMATHQLQVWHYVAGDRRARANSSDAKAHVAVYAREEEKEGSPWRLLRDWEPIESRDPKITISDLPIRPFFTRRRAPFQDWPVFAGSARMMPKLLRRSSEADAMARRIASIKVVFGGMGPGATSSITHQGDMVGIPGDKAWLFEPTGAGYEKLREDLLQIKQEIVSENLSPLTDTGAEMTAEEVGIREQKASSQSEMFTLSDSASATFLMHDWERLGGIENPQITVSVHRPPTLSTGMIRALAEMATARRPLLTPLMILKILEQGSNILPEGTDVRAEAESLASFWGMGGRGYTREGEERLPVEFAEDSSPEDESQQS